MAFNPQLLEVIACPICKGKLDYDKQAQQLICHFDKVAYPIEADIPVLLENRATSLVAASEEVVAE